MKLPNTLSRRLSSPMTGPLAVLCLLWFDFVWVLQREWTQNDQYSYGWLTLGLMLYLIYARSSVRPVPSPGRIPVGGLIVAGALVLIVSRIILGSNPEWHPPLWLHSLTIFGMTLSLLWRLGGGPWLRHFGPAFILMLFAVPWPAALEGSITGGLMQMVAATVVEGMNLCGVYAEQSGNLIRLRNGWVGIEAACSGVRNFQSTLMSAWFVGELFRFSWVGRGLLLLLSGLASLLLNIGRTWILTWSTHRSGSNLTESIHDPVGHIVSLIAFVALLVIAFLLRRFFARPDELSAPVSSGHPSSNERPSPTLSRPVWISALVLLLGGYLLAELWYYRTERQLPEPRSVVIDWPSLPVEFEFVDIPAAIRGQLKYSDGVQAEWADPASGVEWKVFFFSWTKGIVSPFIGVHNPTTCMPTSGFRQGDKHPPLVFELDGERIEFEVTTFYFIDRPYQVYYGTWNDYWGPTVPFVKTAADRFDLVWSGRRLTNRRSLQIVIEGVADEAVARQQVQGFLRQALRWEGDSG